MFSFVGHGQGISIVIEYNIKCFHLMFLKCYHHPYPMANCKIESIDHKVDEDYSLDIFEMIVDTNEPFKELVNRKLLDFKRFRVDAK